ncbi:MAG: peroxiredoxin [Planctomycetota bacterium]|nr:MAG: peroxiredoxin [Planctomycetota bacterium]
MPNPVLSEGQRAPAFTLPATGGGRVRLTELRGRWVVLFFYPRDGSPGCTNEVRAFREQHADLAGLGAVVFGVSPDDLDSHEAFVARERLPFPLLTDRDSRVGARYGVWREKSNYGRKYLGLVRSTFLIDPSGRIVRIFDNVRVKGHVQRVRRALEEQLASGA